MLSLVTLGVRDLAASRRFYTEGLGAAVVLDLPEVVFVQAAHGVLLSLFGVDDLQADAGSDEPAGDPARAPVVFAHNVPDEPAVDAAVDRAVAAGGRVLQRGAPRVVGRLVRPRQRSRRLPLGDRPQPGPAGRG